MQLNYGPVYASPAPYMLGGGDEFCFGMPTGCEKATISQSGTFATVDKITQVGQLVSLYGNVSEGAISRPTGSWSARNAYYLDKGCKQFLNSGRYGPGQYFSTIPSDAVRLLDFTLSGSRKTNVLQSLVNQATNVQGAVGDCFVHLVQVNGRGAVDAESQVHALMQP